MEWGSKKLLRGAIIAIVLLAVLLAIVSYGIYTYQQYSAEQKYQEAMKNRRFFDFSLALYQVDNDAGFPENFDQAIDFYFDSDRKSYGDSIPINPYTGEVTKHISLEHEDSWGDYLYLRFIENGEVVEGMVFSFFPESKKHPKEVAHTGCLCGHTEGIVFIVGIHPDDFFDAIANPAKYGIEEDFIDHTFFDFELEDWEIDEANSCLRRTTPSYSFWEKTTAD